MTALFATVLWLHGVVDQIDGPTALVEWQSTELQEVPVTWLPRGVREGDRVDVRVRIRRDPRRWWVTGRGVSRPLSGAHPRCGTIPQRRDRCPQ